MRPVTFNTNQHCAYFLPGSKIQLDSQCTYHLWIVHCDCRRFQEGKVSVFHPDSSSQLYKARLTTCSDMDTYCLDHMRYSFLAPHWVDKCLVGN